jgi:hypothetical protein
MRKDRELFWFAETAREIWEKKGHPPPEGSQKSNGKSAASTVGERPSIRWLINLGSAVQLLTNISQRLGNKVMSPTVRS